MLRLVVTDLHLDALRACVGDINHVIEHLRVDLSRNRRAAHGEAGLPEGVQMHLRLRIRITGKATELIERWHAAGSTDSGPRPVAYRLRHGLDTSASRDNGDQPNPYRAQHL